MSRVCYIIGGDIPCGDLERLAIALKHNTFKVKVFFDESIYDSLSKDLVDLEFCKTGCFITELDEINKTLLQLESQIVVIGEKPQYSTKLSIDTSSFLRYLATEYHRGVSLILDASDLQKLTTNHANLSISLDQRKYLAVKALQLFSQYDHQLANQIENNEIILGKKVLVIGSGGREHAIVHKISQSDKVDRVFTTPGNSGTASENAKCSNANINSENIPALVEFTVNNDIDLVIVGPEQPLVDGIVDAFTARDIPAFGPSQAASTIEASKAWSKDFMTRHHLPTASYRNFTSFLEAKAYIESLSYRVVVKASGLAAGKGVLIPSNPEEAVAFAKHILEDAPFGTAGNEIVIEQFLEGEEISILAFTDGKIAKGMPPAQDHKRIHDNDEGSNTGGMGAYAPSPLITPQQYRACIELVQQSVTAMASENRPFCGVLYTGFILTKEYGPMILEYNCRFGDPETQVLLPLLQSDLYDIALACVQGRLDGVSIEWSSNYACTVVCTAKGYPESYRKGDIIHGLGTNTPQAKVYHAGAQVNPQNSQEVITNGGRVLSVTGIGSTLLSAVQNAYTRIQTIQFDGMHYRTDIAQRGLKKPLRIGVLGSTRGSSLQPVLDAIANKTLTNVEISLILSNKSTSGILERGREYGIPSTFLSAKDKTREEYDTIVCSALEEAGVDLVLMIGYMRIVSNVFIDHYSYRILNVHPSLLPEFAGGMDLEVHQAVLDAKKSISGCTVHFVTEEVDGGPIVIQLTCEVEIHDTAETLKAKVQALEGRAFIEAIQRIQREGIEQVAADAIAKQHQVAIRTPDVMTYQSAGVDIDAGEALVQRIKPYCKATRRAGCEAELGGFGGLFDLSAAGYNVQETILVSGTDGVGTKLKIAQEMHCHATIGIDLVAMCVNDILVCGAEPLFFLDYYATGKLHVDEASEVVKGIAEGCKLSKCALIGGETAEMADMYAPGEYDLAGFAVGAVHQKDILPQHILPGDVLIGLSSSGVHSNGYSLVRKCVETSGLSWHDPAPFSTTIPNQTLGEALLVPTRIYVDDLLPLLKQHLIKGMAHITGGGLLDNLPRILPENVVATIDIPSSQWTLPPVFQWLQSTAHLSQHDLLRTFNCGIGMVVVVEHDKTDQVLEILIGSTPSGFEPPILLGEIAIWQEYHHEQVVVTGQF